MKRIIFNAAFTLCFCFPAVVFATDCPSLAGVYSSGSEGLCEIGHINQNEYNCKKLVIITQNGCDNYSIFEKDYIANWDNSLSLYPNNGRKRTMLFSKLNTVALGDGDYPVLTTKLVQVDYGLWKTQYVTSTELKIYSYNGFSRRYFQSQIKVVDGRLIVENREAICLEGANGSCTPDAWSNWEQVLNIPKLNEMSQKLPETIWNTMWEQDSTQCQEQT